MIPPKIDSIIRKQGIESFRPAQEKAASMGLFERRSLLICTPTASGKTLVAEMAFLNTILEGEGKAIYVVPLKALAAEKYKDFKAKYGDMIRIGISIGDMDKVDARLADMDLILCTAEKLDSLLRHHTPWIKDVKTLVIDEVHLLNDHSRGPTLEIIITLLRRLVKGMQIIALSATIGNPLELADWLDADLVEDSWRPVKLHKGVILDNTIEFYE